MNDEELIELVRQYSVIYDLSHSKYMDNTYKLNIWKKIAHQMKSDGKYIFNHFYQNLTAERLNVYLISYLVKTF